MSRPLLAQIDGVKRWLLAVAAPREAQAVVEGLSGTRLREEPPIAWSATSITDRFDVVVTGVGKANASGGVARAYEPATHAGVISIGVGGALPGCEAKLGATILANSSIFGDEGAITPGGYEEIASLGFPPNQGMGDGSMGVEISASLLEALGPAAEAVGPVACVSMCSGTDGAAREIAARTSAIVEAMEGAAAGLATRRIGGASALFAELRVISNTTGDRDRQVWRLSEAIEGLRELSALL